MSEEENNETVITVDSIQCNIDRMVLLIFESMRACAAVPLSTSNLATDIIQSYETTLNSIDKLRGINSSPLEQAQKLTFYTDEYRKVKENVIRLEDELVQLHTDINHRLTEVPMNT